jgi:hypothetical protein
VLFSSVVQAQPDSLWSYFYGGAGGDYPAGIVTLPDGDIVWTGTDRSFQGLTAENSSDIVIGCLRADGRVRWERRIELPNAEVATDVVMSSEWYFGIVGRVANTGKGLLIICNEYGEDILDYQLDLGEPGQGTRINRIFSTDDGGYVLSGIQAGSPFLVAVNDWGMQIWTHRYETSLIRDGKLDGAPLPGGGYGLTYSNPDINVLITDEDGNMLSDSIFSDPNVDSHNPSIATCPDGLVLVYQSEENEYQRTGDDCRLVIIDEHGQKQKDVILELEGDQDPVDVLWTENGFVVSAYDYVPVQWQRTVVFVSDAIRLIRTNTDGEILWETAYDDDEFSTPQRITSTLDGGYALAGHYTLRNDLISDSSIGGYVGDIMILKTGPDPLSISPLSGVPSPLSYFLHPAFPNPFNSSTTITFSVGQVSKPVSLAIYDLQGRHVAELVNDRLQAGEHKVVWEASAFPAGIYICRLESGSYSKAVKLLLVK